MSSFNLVTRKLLTSADFFCKHCSAMAYRRDRLCRYATIVLHSGGVKERLRRQIAPKTEGVA